MEALLLKFVEGISSQLGSSSVSFLQFMCCFCFGDKKTELNDRLTTARALLLDADEQQDHTHFEENLIEKLQPILYEAEDLVEEIEIYETADVERRNRVCRFFKTTVPFHIQTAWKLKAINERLAKFIPEGAILPHSGRDGGYRNRNEETRKEQLTYTRSADIIGREKDKEAIKNLVKEDGSNVLIIIAIIGMGGLGKTTLARSVYDDDTEGFDLKIMVWVSQNFDVKRLLIEIIEAATKEKCQLTGMIQLESKLRECLDGKKYLLVLDDIWIDDRESWNPFGNLLKRGAKGSVILATTREMNVASTMRVDPKHQYLLKAKKSLRSPIPPSSVKAKFRTLESTVRDWTRLRAGSESPYKKFYLDFQFPARRCSPIDPPQHEKTIDGQPIKNFLIESRNFVISQATEAEEEKQQKLNRERKKRKQAKRKRNQEEMRSVAVDDLFDNDEPAREPTPPAPVRRTDEAGRPKEAKEGARGESHNPSGY